MHPFNAAAYQCIVKWHPRTCQVDYRLSCTEPFKRLFYSLQSWISKLFWSWLLNFRKCCDPMDRVAWAFFLDKSFQCYISIITLTFLLTRKWSRSAIYWSTLKKMTKSIRRMNEWKYLPFSRRTCSQIGFLIDLNHLRKAFPWHLSFSMLCIGPIINNVTFFRCWEFWLDMQNIS